MSPRTEYDLATTIRERVRLFGRDYVRQHGDETTRALVETLERENAMLRIRATVLRYRDVRAIARDYTRPIWKGIVFSITGFVLAMAIGYLYMFVFLMDPIWDMSDLTLIILDDQVVSVSIPAETDQ